MEVFSLLCFYYSQDELERCFVADFFTCFSQTVRGRLTLNIQLLINLQKY